MPSFGGCFSCVIWDMIFNKRTPKFDGMTIWKFIAEHLKIGETLMWFDTTGFFLKKRFIFL